MSGASQLVQLCESVFQAPARVDRDAGVIHHAKICGKQSPNKYGHAVEGTEYSDGALQESNPRFEGMQVYADHNRQNPKGERAFRELVGVLRNVVVESDGRYGDFHVLKTSPTGQTVLEAAERMPEAFGLSHNADGRGRVVGRKYLIESIPAVRSVDVVTRPATTRGLFESEEQASMATVKELLESRKFADAGAFTALLEEMGADMAGTPPSGGYKDHLTNAVMAVLADSGMDEGTCKKLVTKLVKLIKSEESAEPAEPASSGVAAAESIDVPALKTKLATLESRDAVRTLCESLDFTPKPHQLTALCGIEGVEPRRALIADFKAAKAPAKATTGARSNSLRTLQESTASTAPATTKEEAKKRIFSRN